MAADAEDATYAAIGRFVSEFSLLEESLRICLGMEIGLRQNLYSPVLTHDFALLCTALVEVCSEKMDGPALSKLKKQVSSCRELNDLRVRVAHGTWRPGNDAVSYVSRQKLKRAHFSGMKKVLDERAEQAKNLSLELEHLYMQHMLEKRAKREMSKKRRAIGRLTG